MANGPNFPNFHVLVHVLNALIVVVSMVITFVILSLLDN